MGKATGRKFSRRRLLDLMISTYENSVEQNRQLRRLQAKLQEMNTRLEDRVKERTAEVVRHSTILGEAEQIANTGGWEWDIVLG